MAAIAENNKNMFTFTWSIENFSMCSQQINEYITSPGFPAGMIKNSEFILRLYPKGNGSENNMSCFLERCDDRTDDITLSFDIRLECRYPISAVRKAEINYTFGGKNKSWPCEKLVSYEDIITNEDERYLSNDVLILKCYLWLVPSETFAFDDSAIFKHLNTPVNFSECSEVPHTIEISPDSDAAITSLKKKFCTYPFEILARSRIHMERKCVKWSITDFSSCLQSQKICVPIPCQLKRDPTLLIVMKFNKIESTDSEIAKIEIHKTDPMVEQPLNLKCKITVLGNRIDSNIVKEASYFFKPDEKIWNFPPIIKNMISADKQVYLPNDVLTLQCDFTISDGAIFSWLEEIQNATIEFQNLVLAYDTSTRNLKSDFNDLYEDKPLCDVSLRIEKQFIGAHKAVLFARSDVFKAMFDTNMKEKETNVVKIKDMDADTLRIMLKFMYTDILELSDIKRAAKLFSAAERYQVGKLKKMCSDFIKANVTLSNFYDILLLSHIHCDNELESIVLNLICLHKTKVLQSEQWLKFMKSWPRLSRSVLYKICIKLPDI